MFSKPIGKQTWAPRSLMGLKKVAHGPRVHNIRPFGPLVKENVHIVSF